MKKTLESRIDEVIWRLMVGCATARIEPKEKTEYVKQILSLFRQIIEEAIPTEEMLPKIQIGDSAHHN